MVVWVLDKAKFESFPETSAGSENWEADMNPPDPESTGSNRELDEES
jgi:hypothetical protein